jgi:hypothetical protein
MQSSRVIVDLSSRFGFGLTWHALIVKGEGMRWDRLFADLEARFDEIGDAEAAAELADRQRVAIGVVRATQRLAGSIDQAVRVRLAGGASIGGVLRTVGPDWLLLVEARARECIVALSAVTAVEGLTASTAPVMTGLSLRLDLRRALRGLARDRSPVAIGLTGWSGGLAGTEPASVAGSMGSAEVIVTIDRVGADFVEVAVHAAWEPRRAGTVRSVALVPLGAVVLVRAMPLG